MAFEIGNRIGDYEVIDVLGAGGMGKVYKVRNLISERIEAMKVLLPNLATNPDLEGRFLREIKTLATLEHPNIAQLRTALRIENQLLMIMEYVEGVSLAQRLTQGRPALAESADWVSQVLSALSYAHGHGVIHRDIKPANMMLTPSGVVKLMDFGIAKGATEPKLTMTGQTVGSLSYMSPEQVKALPLDARSDLYSLGVSLYEMTTGRRPFKEDSDYALMAAHLQKMPTPPIEVDPSLPPTLNAIILMALAKDPAGRFQTAAAFQTALDSVRASLGPVVRTPVMPAGGTTLGGGAAPATAAGPGATFLAGGSSRISGSPGQASTLPMTAGPAAPATPPGATALGAGGAPLASTQTPYPQPPASPPAYTPPPSTPLGVQYPPSQPAPPRSYRGFYMTAGALVAIAVVVVGATQLPKLYRARAGGNAQAPAEAPAPATQQPAAAGTPAADPNQANPPAATNPAGETANPAAGAAPAPAVEAPPAPAPEPVRPAEAAGASAPPPLAHERPLVRKPAGHGEEKAPVERRMMGSEQGQPREGPPSGPPPALISAGQEQVDKQTENKGAPNPEMREARRRLAELTARARAVRSSFEQLEQQQRAQGLGPRQDMKGAIELMGEYMDMARDAMAGGAAAEAQEDMDRAEKPLERLEKFFGR